MVEALLTEVEDVGFVVIEANLNVATAEPMVILQVNVTSHDMIEKKRRTRNKK